MTTKKAAKKAIKNKGGRQPLDGQSPMPRMLRMRMSESEWQRLVKAAGKADKSMSDFMRSLIPD